MNTTPDQVRSVAKHGMITAAVINAFKAADDATKERISALTTEAVDILAGGAQLTHESPSVCGLREVFTEYFADEVAAAGGPDTIEEALKAYMNVVLQITMHLEGIGKFLQPDAGGQFIAGGVGGPMFGESLIGEEQRDAVDVYLEYDAVDHDLQLWLFDQLNTLWPHKPLDVVRGVAGAMVGLYEEAEVIEREELGENLTEELTLFGVNLDEVTLGDAAVLEQVKQLWLTLPIKENLFDCLQLQKVIDDAPLEFPVGSDHQLLQQLGILLEQKRQAASQDDINSIFDKVCSVFGELVALRLADEEEQDPNTDSGDDDNAGDKSGVVFDAPEPTKV